MITTQQIILACWIIFMLYWFISARSVKPDREAKGWLVGYWYRILLLIGALFIINFRSLAAFGVPVKLLSMLLIPHLLLIRVLAVVFDIAGLITAIAARWTLAGNWSGAVVIKDGHELITRGLYRYVRNPIYTGILLMVLGTTLAYGTLGACIGFLIIGLTIWLKLHNEETILTEHFSEQYKAYKKSTKTLIPFIW
jgi:protein-S-isoprenylcysteine O-methyltransferase Ste14